MAINKVVYGSTTLVDLTNTTATADKILSGYGAYGADGAWMDGTATGGGDDGYIWQDAEGYIHLSTEGEHQTNLQARTVEPQLEEQVISVNSPLLSENAKEPVSSRTEGNNLTASVINVYCQTASIEAGKNYHFTGNAQVIDSDEQILDSFTFDSNAELKTTQTTIYTAENANDYIRKINVFYSNNRVYVVWHFGKTATFAIDADLSIYNVSGEYDGLSSVTVASGYSVDVVTALITRSTIDLSEKLPTGITSIGDYAFANFGGNLTLNGLPDSITLIGDYAFYYCNNITLASLPNFITSIGQYAFSGCRKLALTSLPSNITLIQSHVFDGCNKLALTSLPSGVTSIGTYGFYNCHLLALTSLPSSLKTIDSNAFGRCPSLVSLSCDGALTSIGSNAFTGSSSYQMMLEEVRFPNAVMSTFGSAFGNTTAANACQHLELADIGATVNIAANAFANCYALQTLILRKTDAITTLANVSAFLNTPMRGYNSLTGTIYVPSALISTYQTATNWSTLYDAGTITFAAIEGSEYELD